jgi:hypothetical protein
MSGKSSCLNLYGADGTKSYQVCAGGSKVSIISKTKDLLLDVKQLNIKNADGVVINDVATILTNLGNSSTSLTTSISNLNALVLSKEAALFAKIAEEKEALTQLIDDSKCDCDAIEASISTLSSQVSTNFNTLTSSIAEEKASREASDNLITTSISNIQTLVGADGSVLAGIVAAYQLADTTQLETITSILARLVVCEEKFNNLLDCDGCDEFPVGNYTYNREDGAVDTIVVSISGGVLTAVCPTQSWQTTSGNVSGYMVYGLWGSVNGTYNPEDNKFSFSNGTFWTYSPPQL